jgi:hypothetical protein
VTANGLSAHPAFATIAHLGTALAALHPAIAHPTRAHSTFATLGAHLSLPLDAVAAHLALLLNSRRVRTRLGSRRHCNSGKDNGAKGSRANFRHRTSKSGNDLGTMRRTTCSTLEIREC